MNGERLLALYDRVAEAPDAVDRLCRFVLDLAVRGKLVKQEPGDKPATELLTQIEAEKARLKLRNRLNPLTSEEIPFALPAGWDWSRIGELCTKTGSGSTPRGGKSVYRDSGIPFLRSQNVFDWGLRLDGVAYIGPDVHARMAGTAVHPGDLLLNITGGSMGRCARVPSEFSMGNVSQHVAIVRPAIPEMADFLHKLILSPYFQRFIFGEQTGAGRGGLPKNRMDQIPVAVPPLAEQRRIVAKIKELMTVCDRLEKSRTAQEETRDKLSKAAFARLNAPDANSATFRSDARFAINGLSFLTARGDQIRVLRQNVLNLAVRGKLTKQKPGEETAAELLKRLVARKGRQEKISKARKQKSLPPVTEPPFHIPESWLWVRIREVTSDRGQMIPDARFTYIDVTAIDKNNGVINGPKVLLPQEAPSRARKIVRQGDVIYSCVRPYLLNVAIIEDDYDPAPIASTAFAILNGHGLVVRGYLWIVLRSPYMVERVQQNQRGQAYPAINDADFALLPFPLPPLPEQHRIVKKVDNLMSLCDQLDAGLSSANAIRNNLLGSSLHQTLQRTQLN